MYKERLLHFTLPALMRQMNSALSVLCFQFYLLMNNNEQFYGNEQEMYT